MTTTDSTVNSELFTWVRFKGFVLGVYRCHETKTESQMSIRFARSLKGLAYAPSIKFGTLRSNPAVSDDGLGSIWNGVSIDASSIETVRSKLFEFGGPTTDIERFLRFVRNLIYLVEHVERMAIDLDDLMADLWRLDGSNFQHCQ